MQPKFRLVLYRGYYAASWKDRGRIHRASLRTKDREAANQALRNFADQYEMANRPKIITVEYVWNGYSETLKGRPAFQNMRYEGRSVLPFFGHMAAAHVGEDVCLSYESRRREAGRKSGTIWTELGRLRSALKWAERKNLIAKAPYIFRPAMSPPRDLRLTREQANLFLSSCITPHIRLFAVLAMTTGARTGALLSLKWNLVDLERKLLDLNAERCHQSQIKSIGRMKGRAIVPINRTLMAALHEAKNGALSDFVVEWDGGAVKSVKKGLAATGKRCDLPWVSAHVFRHSAASWMAEAGVSMDRIAAFLGHSDSRITSRVYAKFSPDYLRDAAEALEINVMQEIKVKNGS